MAAARVTGHVLLKERQRGAVYYMKYRLTDGRQVMKLLGPAWTERSRPPAGYYTKRTAEEELNALLADARRGTLPDSQARSGRTFGDACIATSGDRATQRLSTTSSHVGQRRSFRPILRKRNSCRVTWR